MSLLSTSKGPKYNIASVTTIKGQDHLGIRSVGISIADHLQSGITSITPRARYYAFFAWVLHDFIQLDSIEKSMKNFKSFLKKQEWFYILANIAEAEERGATTHDVIGISKGIEEWRKQQEHLEVQLNYVQDSFGGYGTYRNVMKIVGITMIGDEEKGIQIDRLTEATGKVLAEAFESSIKHTEYYRDYRLTDNPVPRKVILEYGKASALDVLKASKAADHSILTNIFMPEKPKALRQELRKNSMLYYMNIINQSKGNKLTFAYFQDMMFDGFFQQELEVPQSLATVARGWEIYQARQLFTYSLDTIWSYLLNHMSKKIEKMPELISAVLTELKSSGYDLTEQVKDLNTYIPLSKDQRNAFISNMRSKDMNGTEQVWQPLLVMLHVYDRLLDREDFESFHQELLKLGGRDGISFTTWLQFVQSYQEKSVGEFLSYILRYFILEQHQKVALNKMITTRNETYHFVENDGKLYFIADDQPAFNTFRVNQGLSLLVDLGLIQELKGVYEVTSVGKGMLNGTN